MMKKLVLSIGVLIAIIGIAIGVMKYFAFDYPYDRDVNSYYRLAVDTATLKDKSEYLSEYLTALSERGLNQGQGVLFFQTPKTDLAKQYAIVSAFNDRMKTGFNMTENSLEYQQLMAQIEAHEIDYVNSDTFKSGYEIKTGWVWGGILSWAFIILGMVFAVLSPALDD